jgi:glutamate dehydrogenase/leucine dehydrogenase
VVIALETLLKIMPSSRFCPSSVIWSCRKNGAATVLFQGFGAVGAHAARIMQERLPNALTTGLSDFDGYLHMRKGSAGG